MEGTEAKWWTMVSPKRRQELSLGLLVVSLVLGLGVTAKFIRRAQLRRRAT